MSSNGILQSVWTTNAPVDNAGANANWSGSPAAQVANTFNYVNGVAPPSQADLYYVKRLTVGAGATYTLDFGTGGNVTPDIYGASIIPWVEVVAIKLVNRSAVAGDIITFGPDSGTNPLLLMFTNAAYRISIGPAAFFSQVYPTGWAVTDGAADRMTIVEIGGVNPVSFDLFIVGRSA